MLLQRNDGGSGLLCLQAGDEALQLHFNDLVGACCLALAAGYVGADHCLQIVNVIDKDAIQLVHLRIDVAGHGDINEKHRTVLAPVQKALAVLPAENCAGRAGGGNHNVGAVGGVIELFKADSGALEFFRQCQSARMGAVGHKDGFRSTGHKMPRRQLTHLARAHQVDVLAGKRSEDLRSQIHRCRCH